MKRILLYAFILSLMTCHRPCPASGHFNDEERLQRTQDFLEIMNPHTDSLHLNRLGISRVPKLNAFHLLVSLDLSSNRLTDLPNTFGEMKLTFLDASFNQITSINFAALPRQLRVLKLEGNNLETLPLGLPSIRRLHELYLGRNQLSCLPEDIGDCVQLTMLDLNHNLLKSLPEEFGNAKKLATLNLKGNQLTTLPGSFGKLEKLKVLDVSHNQLQQLPRDLNNCEDLEELDLKNNKLRDFPFSYGGLIYLKKLDIAKNQLSYIPSFIGEVENLRFFNCDNNPFLIAPQELLNIFMVLGMDFYQFPGNERYNEEAERETISIIEMLKSEHCQGCYVYQNGKFETIGNAFWKSK